MRWAFLKKIKKEVFEFDGGNIDCYQMDIDLVVFDIKSMGQSLICL